MSALQANDYIMDAQQALAGLIGATIMVLRDPKKRTRAEKIASIMAGTAAAVYLTEPIVSFIWKDAQPKYLLGFSFLFGVSGLKVIEIICDFMEKTLKKKLEEKSQ